MIGILLTMGIVKKTSILIVEFSNQLRDEGKELYDAISVACETRFRPILMTTFATVFGALPLAFSSGAGSEARQAIGWVIVGGMSLGTILTLIIIPVFYFMIVNKISGESTST